MTLSCTTQIYAEGFSIGSSVTSFRLKQSSKNQHTEDIYLTARLGLTLKGKTSLFSAGSSFFGNYLSIRHTSSLAKPQILGANVRVGARFVRVPKSSFIEWSLGWYFYSMQDAHQSYGFSMVAGPQLFIQTNIKVKNSYPIWLYVKIAPLFGEANRLSLANREFAAGFGLRLTESQKRKNTLSLVGDASQLKYSTANSVTVQSQQMSLGFQFGF